MKSKFELEHIGINTPNAEEAEKLANLLSLVFNLESRHGQKSEFAGPYFECMKAPFLGTNGHIAMRTPNLAAAMEELKEKGVSALAIEKLQPILNLSGTNQDKLSHLREILKNSETGLKGIDELSKIFRHLDTLELQIEIKLDLTLARGLSYYTGAIFEVKAKGAEMGSITGGGRYDDLTGIFGMKNMSGVGISFGADRIFDVMNQLDLFPQDSTATTQILFVNFGEQEEAYCLPLLKKLRGQGINAEIFPETSKMKKQMGYADKKNIPFVALVGENEIANHLVTLKNMHDGTQESIPVDDLIDKLRNNK